MINIDALNKNYQYMKIHKDKINLLVYDTR